MSAPESWYATRTLRALEVLALRPGSASDVADELQVHPRTARRLLNRLVADGYLARGPGERRLYSPTMRIVGLAGEVLERTELAQQALPFVQRLARDTGLPAHLSLPGHRSVLCLARHDDDAPAAPPRLTEMLPAHCTASGKALLAHRERWREGIVTSRLERHTERTLVDPRDLRYDLARIRSRGFAFEDREHQPDIRAVAAPVDDHDGDAIAALGVSGALDELALERLPQLARAVIAVAVAASDGLGGRCDTVATEPYAAAGRG